MSTHNIDFYEDLTKKSLSYHQMLSNTHLISSDGPHPCYTTQAEGRHLRIHKH